MLMYNTVFKWQANSESDKVVSKKKIKPCQWITLACNKWRRQINLNNKCGCHCNRDRGISIPKTTGTVRPESSQVGYRRLYFQVFHYVLLFLSSDNSKEKRFTLPVSTSFSSVQFTQSCPTLCDPMNRSTPGLPVHHQLPEFTQTHDHWVSEAIQPSHSLPPPSPPAPQALPASGSFPMS